MSLMDIKDSFLKLMDMYSSIDRAIARSPLPFIISPNDSENLPLSFDEPQSYFSSHRHFLARIITNTDKHQPFIPEGIQAVMCIDKDTFSLIQMTNEEKLRFKGLIKLYKFQSNIKPASIISELMSDPQLSALKLSLGISHISLSMLYKKIYAFNSADPLNGVSFGWSSSNKSSKIISFSEAISFLETSIIDHPDKTFYYDLLSKNAGPKSEFFISRPLVSHQIVNVRHENDGRWVMHKTRLPILVVSESLPEVVFRQKQTSSSDTSRIKRSDSALSSATLLVPALNIYVRLKSR